MPDASGALNCVGQIRPIAHDVCNGFDDDCNGVVDDMPPEVCGLGACRVEVPACLDGEPVGCVPGTPVPEVCGNGIDDDCNGAVDDGCDCLFVSAAEGSPSGDGSFASPFQTIAQASAAAASGPPRSICIDGDTYVETAPIVMRDGVHVLGGYDLSGSAPSRPGRATRIIAAAGGASVIFPATVTGATVLNGVEVSDPTPDAAPNAAVFVDGATGAVIADAVLLGGVFGLDVAGSEGALARAVLTRNRIVGGVRSIHGTLLIEDHCDAFDDGGRCNVDTSTLGIFQRTNPLQNPRAVSLTDAPGTVVRRSLIRIEESSAGFAIVYGFYFGDPFFGLSEGGNADGVRVTQSAVVVETISSAQFGAGLAFSGCGSSAPLIDNNRRIYGGSTGRTATAVHTANCGITVANNLDVSVDEGASVLVAGVHCSGRATCHVLENARISTLFPAGDLSPMMCEGPCGRIEGNTIVQSFTNVDTAGIDSRTDQDAVVRRNTIELQCAVVGEPGAVAGIRNIGRMRIESNVIRFVGCEISASPTLGRLLGVELTNLSDTLLLSNTIRFDMPVRGGDDCDSAGIGFDPRPVNGGNLPHTGLIAVNNIIGSSHCATRQNISLVGSTGIDGFMLDTNNLPVFADGDTLLLGVGGAVTTLDALHTSTEVTASNTISVDPQFLGRRDERLAETSQCVDAATPEMSSTIDVTGAVRPQGPPPDIGAHER
jgi:hypothetical protein